MTNVEQSYRDGSRPGPLWLSLGILAVGMFAVATNAFVIAGLLPDIAAEFGVSVGAASSAVSAYALSVAIAAPAITMLLPRVPRAPLMAAGALIVSVGTLLAAFANTLDVFIVARIIAGLGGAALVPTSSATAAAIAPPHRRGIAIAAVTLGFSVATALGAPLGTAIGAHGHWRTPLIAVAVLALLVAIAILPGVRGVPRPAVTGFLQRLAPLRDGRIVAAIVTNVLITAGFNAVYVFSAEITADATGGNGQLLAALLLAYGIASVAGNTAVGPVVDRLGSRRTATTLILAEIALFAILPLALDGFWPTAIVFALWGLTAASSAVPVQHRLVEVQPETAGLALSWFTTAMYLGVALAPPLGAIATGIGGTHAIPAAAAIVTIAGLAVFQLTYRRRWEPRITASVPVVG